jgi:predicted protein tyrosine phosphatase
VKYGWLQRATLPKVRRDRFADREERIVCLDFGHSTQFEDLQLMALLDMLVDDAEATRH